MTAPKAAPAEAIALELPAGDGGNLAVAVGGRTQIIDLGHGEAQLEQGAGLNHDNKTFIEAG